MNMLGLEFDYHIVGIFMLAKVKKDECQVQNREPEKCNNWQWIKWEELVTLDNLFIPFEYLFL